MKMHDNLGYMNLRLENIREVEVRRKMSLRHNYDTTNGAGGVGSHD